MRAGRIVGTILSLGLVWLAGVACPAEPPCDFNDSVLAPDEPGVLSIVEGDGGTALPGAVLTLSVALSDHTGLRVCTGVISWSPTANSGTVANSATRTDAAGVASTTWTLGPTLGTQSVTAALDRWNPPVTVTFTATVVAAHLEIVSGDMQAALGGSVLPDLLEVRLVGEDGGLAPRTNLTWQVTGGGTVAEATTESSPNDGRSQNEWTLGPAGMAQAVTVSEPSGSSVTFTATATPPAGSHPKAEISAYNGTLTPGVIVTMQTPYDGEQTFGPLAPSTQDSDSLQVEVGQAFQITAVVGAQSGSVTCTTGPAIIPDSSDPVNTGHAMVAVFTNAGVFLTCNGAWMSVGAGRASRQSSQRP
jgi:hypothetical protein